MITDIFNKLFYQPLFNILILLYTLVPGRDFGVAVALLTLLIRILLYPFNLESIKSQRALSKLDPKLKEIKKKFKNDKERVARETLGLYQKEKINPFSGFLLILIQLPILFALYKVFNRVVFVEELNFLYSFVPNPGEIKPYFLTIDLSKPHFYLALFAGISQFFQAKVQDIRLKTETKKFGDFSEIFQKQMLYFFPAFTFIILLKIPSAIALYLIVSTTFSILQILYVRKKGLRKN